MAITSCQLPKGARSREKRASKREHRQPEPDCRSPARSCRWTDTWPLNTVRIAAASSKLGPGLKPRLIFGRPALSHIPARSVMLRPVRRTPVPRPLRRDRRQTRMQPPRNTSQLFPCRLDPSPPCRARRPLRRRDLRRTRETRLYCPLHLRSNRTCCPELEPNRCFALRFEVLPRTSARSRRKLLSRPRLALRP